MLREIFRTAYQNELINNDITKNLSRPKGIPPKERRNITSKERTALLTVLNGHRGEVFIKLQLYCGLRPGEALALKWCDIDFNNNIININKARKKDGQVGPPKSKAGNRDIPIPTVLVGLLKAQKQEPFNLVCTQIKGSPHTESSKKKLWKNIKRKMNIEMGCNVYRNELIPPYPLTDDFVMYNLRHTYCTDLQKAGVPIDVARRLMGHSSIDITSKIYTHASSNVLEQARDLINLVV